MTIAAGVWCTDGLVICADTEISQGDSKYERPKIFSHDDWLLVTGAGSFDYLEMAYDKLRERMRSDRPEDPFVARQLIEKVVLGIYKNIASIFEVINPQSPQFEMIVGIRCANGELALVKSSYSGAVALTKAHIVAVGAGWPLFEYWGRYFFPWPRTMDVTSCFCMFILSEIKQSVFGCGGGTHVFKLPKDISEPKHFKHVFSEKDLLAGFPQTVVNILLECADGTNPKYSMGMWGQQVDQLSQYFKSQRDQKDRMKLAFEEIHEINKPPEGKK